MERTALDVLLRRLWIEYVAVWLLTAGVALLYETGVMSEGGLAHDGQMCYVVQTLTVLLTLCLIPVSLKMYSMALGKSCEGLSPQALLVRYQRWNEVRLALLAVVALTGISVYYVTLSSIGGLCSLLGLTATLFCLPTRKRVEMDLNGNEETDSCHSQL